MCFPKAEDASNATSKVLNQGEVQGRDVSPHAAGILDIKTTILADADALFVTAINRYGHELWR